MTIHESIAKATKKLMLEEPFYGLFLITLKKEIDESVGTMGVSKNGINVQLSVSEKFWNQLTETWQVGLMKHELLHVCFDHLLIRDGFDDKLLFNIAADIEINQYIKDGYLPPKGHDLAGFYLDTYPDLNLPPKAGTRFYYDALKEALKKANGGQCEDPGTGQSQVMSDGKIIPSLNDTVENFRQNSIDIHKSWKKFEELSESEKKLIQKQYHFQLKEVHENLKNRGKTPGELQQLLKELLEIKPPVFNWKAYFRRFSGISQKIYTRKTRRKDSKRYEGNPALKIKTKQHILIAVDTSNSVSDTELLEFFNEVHHIYKTGVAVTVLQCDADIHSIEEYKGKFNGRITGRGGTSFQPPIDYYDKNNKKYTSLVFFTDGYAPSPTKPKNKMLWVISSNGKGSETLPWYQIKIENDNKR